MVQYFRAMEERIQSLELQVAKLSGSTTQRGEKAVVMPGPNRQSLGSPAKAWILRLTEDEFEGPSPKGEPVHVIELLDDDDGALKKIRIRSEQLLKTLRDVMGPSIIPDISRSMVMTRPFKVLLSFEQELRLKKAEVEQETEDQAFHDSNEYPEATAEPTKPGNLAESGKNASKTDLDVLIEVLTYDLAEDSAAYRYTRTRSEELVTFPQLWYLFQPGDTVVDGRGSSVQAYRVLSVHEKIPRDGETVAEALPDMTSVVSIRCIYIGFNGTMFGPVGKTFTIGYFHGKRSITSLPIVPIDFHKGFDMAKLLVDRGSSFRLFSTSRHAAYQGMTMDKELPTELDGEVMVDTNLYYRDHPDLIPPDFATAITDEEVREQNY
ncbi:hypothetical protein F4777DRAFT_509626 [Nemania sp. FL0916]|nr:hypothetical protein F4777DRAFT_509626 [Nemania sp. FL0916]